MGHITLFVVCLPSLMENSLVARECCWWNVLQPEPQCTSLQGEVWLLQSSINLKLNRPNCQLLDIYIISSILIPPFPKALIKLLPFFSFETSILVLLLFDRLGGSNVVWFWLIFSAGCPVSTPLEVIVPARKRDKTIYPEHQPRTPRIEDVRVT